ncbi:hypothetical protein HELRODRAFT_171472 [Helobdella robusta]|uniref:Uncharacterized protein n=1 Tax=Helobdella robusta TaxID=6412 RepID=T1F4C0_HELRO|nr:hypothetical protein HELRODRAFT_171472 [Helobdella robusta]ESO05799.1 hypothetical protein HELRODRAFT_171472 [Helobdella robusta]
MSLLLQKIRYCEYNWSIRCDLKVAAILTGLQAGYTKYCCFLCEWDSRDRIKHYVKKNWPIRNKMQPRNKMFNIHHSDTLCYKSESAFKRTKVNCDCRFRYKIGSVTHCDNILE